jgi:hypothetical protein
MDIAAIGSTVEEAVESACRKAMDLFDAFSKPYPSTLLVHIEEPYRDGMAVQSIHAPFLLKNGVESRRFKSPISMDLRHLRLAHPISQDDTHHHYQWSCGCSAHRVPDDR